MNKKVNIRHLHCTVEKGNLDMDKLKKVVRMWQVKIRTFSDFNK